MTTYNTDADSANTAVRAFLTKVGEYYLGRSFNTASGQGKKDWVMIKEQVFGNECAYCGNANAQLQMEHLIMFNRAEYGLHHPGNLVPCCAKCNNRRRREDKSYMTWQEHLREICIENDALDKYVERLDRINNHFYTSDFKYPTLSDEEKNAIRVMANSVYQHVKVEINKSLDLYKELREAFVETIGE